MGERVAGSKRGEETGENCAMGESIAGRSWSMTVDDSQGDKAWKRVGEAIVALDRKRLVVRADV